VKPVRCALALVLALAALPRAPRPGGGDLVAAARAAEGWSAEFEDLCNKTQDAMALTDAELRTLVERCDRLMPVLEKLPGPERKVYSRRLRGCRDLYQFVLDSRATKGAG
jgi:hypothetical protein